MLSKKGLLILLLVGIHSSSSTSLPLKKSVLSNFKKFIEAFKRQNFSTLNVYKRVNNDDKEETNSDTNNNRKLKILYRKIKKLMSMINKKEETPKKLNSKIKVMNKLRIMRL